MAFYKYRIWLQNRTTFLCNNRYFEIQTWPSPKWQILHSSKLKDFEDDNCKFDENGRKFSKWVENTVGKGEIACYKQLLLFPKCFQKTCTADT